ncbi:protein lin-28 homolog A-like isoform X1, partial [Lates japonicus]
MGSVSNQEFPGVCKTEEDEGPSTEEDSQSFHGVGVCKWFNVRMGFGFLSMTNREGVPLDEPVDVFVHQSPALILYLCVCVHNLMVGMWLERVRYGGGEGHTWERKWVNGHQKGLMGLGLCERPCRHSNVMAHQLCFLAAQDSVADAQL